MANFYNDDSGRLIPAIFGKIEGSPFGNKHVVVNKLGEGDRNVLERLGIKIIGGVSVDPGYNLCVYTGMNQNGTSHCFGPGNYDLLKEGIGGGKDAWWNAIGSFKLRKDCDNPIWMWDKDCEIIDNSKNLAPCVTEGSVCNQNRLLYCNKQQDYGKIDHKCIEFCNNNHGLCDQMMLKYCGLPENKDNIECACINSPALKYNPVCIDSNCIRGGYTTKTMMEKPCPDMVDCGVYYDIKDTHGNIDFADNDIHQRCGNSHEAPQVPNPPNNAASLVANDERPVELPATKPLLNPGTWVKTTPSSWSWIWKVVIALIILIVLALAGLYIYRHIGTMPKPKITVPAASIN